VETKNRWGFFKFLEFIGDARLMITHNFRLGFITSNFTSISYDSSSQGGYSSLK